MRVKIEGVKQTRKALRDFAPDLNKQLNAELKVALAPIAKKARGFVPSDSPMSGWASRSFSEARFPFFNASVIRSGIGFTTKAGKTTRSGFTSNATIFNKSVAGAIYETAGRVNPQGRVQAKRKEVNIPGMNSVYTTSTGKNFGKSNNPNAGQQFIDAINSSGEIKNAYKRETGQAGRASRKMKGRAIFRAWAEDQGKTNAAIIKAIETSRDKFNKAVGYN